MRLLERLEDDERLDGLLQTLERRAPDASTDGFSDGMHAHGPDLWWAAVFPPANKRSTFERGESEWSMMCQTFAA